MIRPTLWVEFIPDESSRGTTFPKGKRTSGTDSPIRLSPRYKRFHPNTNWSTCGFWIKPISSEHGLRYFERDVVENAAQKLVDAVYENTLLRDRLGLRGTVTFESHTNLGIPDDVPESFESMSLTEPKAGDARRDKARRTAKGKGMGKGNRADQFCIYRTTDGKNIPAMAIEYKAPHKLMQDEVVTGLASEIQPKRDVINRTTRASPSRRRRLAAAVVTQLFSYMDRQGHPVRIRLYGRSLHLSPYPGRPGHCLLLRVRAKSRRPRQRREQTPPDRCRASLRVYPPGITHTTPTPVLARCGRKPRYLGCRVRRC